MRGMAWHSAVIGMANAWHGMAKLHGMAWHGNFLVPIKIDMAKHVKIDGRHGEAWHGTAYPPYRLFGIV